MPNTTQNHSLNELTLKVTAFQSWSEFAAAMDRGYMPTLMSLPGRSNRVRNVLVKELADKLESLGWKVWRGTNDK